MHVCSFFVFFTEKICVLSESFCFIDLCFFTKTSVRLLCSRIGQKKASYAFMPDGNRKVMKVFDTRIGFYIFGHWRWSAQLARNTSFIWTAVFCPDLMCEN